jgi:hypothetical protein
LTSILSSVDVLRNGVKISFLEVFKNRSYSHNNKRSKSALGKIQENFIFFQRLSQLHPYGYKLRQVFSAVDIKRTSRRGFPGGIYSYRLSTYDNIEDSLPIRDFRGFKFPRHENKYLNPKFIGTIYTDNKTMFKGEILKESLV